MFFLFAAVNAFPVELDLSGRWDLAKGHDGDVLCGIDVPGDVHAALLAAGKIEDCFYGTNEVKALWIGKTDWRISRRFHVGEDVLKKKIIVLRLEDVDCFCEIRVNGRTVGRTTDRFQRYEFNLKDVLVKGENTIEGLFTAPETEADRRRKKIGRPYPMSNVIWSKNQALIRKPACHAGWDWGPSVQVTGFCGTTRIIASDSPYVTYIYSTQEFNSDFSHCTLAVTAELSDGSKVRKVFEIDDPPLWWPNGAGEQKFYTYEIDVNGEKITRRIGLRKIEVLNEKTFSPDGKEELSMTFRVNGRRIFMKGANWIPCSAYETEQTAGRYADLLASARDANMNMLRVWGGGQYEKDVFYDLCDEYGILIWHDMMCSCAVYPGEEWFLDEIRTELAHQLRRLRDHASIAMWCGDNECLGAIKWFTPTRKNAEFYRGEWVKRSKMQAEAVARYDAQRTYWPSSPCCGPGDFGDGWKEDSKGDMHNWDVWHENAEFSKYYMYRPRFCSEFGYQSFPSMETALTFASLDEVLSRGAEFEWHQKNRGGNRRIRETMLRYFRPVKGVPEELFLSQVQQAMAIKTAVEAWRALRPRCMGTLFWQLNDNWPVASWSSVEYGGKWKPLQYVARRFFAPVAVQAGPGGAINAVNDLEREVEFDLLAEYWGFDGKLLDSDKFKVKLAPSSAAAVGTWKKRDGAFLYLRAIPPADAPFSVYPNDWLFGNYKDFDLARCNIDTAFNGFEVTLVSDKPAFWVWADVRGIKGRFNDNAFTMVPGVPVRIRFKPDDPLVTPERFKAAFSITHLRETY